MTTPRNHIHRAEPITLPAGSNLVPVIRFVAQCSSSSPLAAVLNKDAAVLLLTPLMVGYRPPALPWPSRTYSAVRPCSL